jgi:hypothetical protein
MTTVTVKDVEQGMLSSVILVAMGTSRQDKPKRIMYNVGYGDYVVNVGEFLNPDVIAIGKNLTNIVDIFNDI